MYYMSNLELFHGSPISGIEVLEPRVAHNAVLQGVYDIPAVYASDDIEFATFMAVIGKRSWGGWDAKTYGGKGFYLYEEFLEYLDTSMYLEPVGTVYQLETESFELNTRGEWVSRSPVKVMGSIAVGVSDLPNFAVSDERHPSYYRKLAKQEPEEGEHQSQDLDRVRCDRRCFLRMVRLELP